MVERTNTKQQFGRYLWFWSIVHLGVSIVVIFAAALVEKFIDSDALAFYDSLRTTAYVVVTAAPLLHTIAFQIIVLIPTYITGSYTPEKLWPARVVACLATLVITALIASVFGATGIVAYAGDPIVTVLLCIFYLTSDQDRRIPKRSR